MEAFYFTCKQLPHILRNYSTQDERTEILSKSTPY